MEKRKSEHTLQIRRIFEASCEKVFRAWTEPQQMKKWFAPSDGFSTSLSELDLRVGGKYRLEMRSPDGKIHCAFGTYKEINPHKKLVFTWSWEEDPSIGETLVTLEFHDQGSSTELLLTHEFFPNEDQRQQHLQGWSGCLDRLPKAL